MATRELNPSVSRRATTATIAAPMVIGLIVLIVGMMRVGDRSFWYDELYTAVFVRRPFPAVISSLQHEAGMGPYYVGLFLWGRFGGSESWLRMFSVLGAAATAVATYELARRNLGRRVALISVIGLMCNPVFVTYATELRAYSWMMFTAVLTTALVLRLRTHPDSQWTLVVYGLAAGTLIALNVFCIFMVAVQVGWVLVSSNRRYHVRFVGTISAATALVLAPFLNAYLTSDQLNWIPKLSLDRLWNVVLESFGGSWWFVFLTVGTVGTVAMLASGRSLPRARSLLFLAVASSIALTAGLVILSFFKSFLLARYLAPMIPLVVIAASYGLIVGLAMFLDRGRSGLLVLSIAVVVVYFIGFPGSPLRDPERGENFRAAGRFLSHRVEPGDAVLFTQPWIVSWFDYYWRPNADVIAWDGDRALSSEERNARSKAYCQVFRVDRLGLPDAVKARWDAEGQRYRVHWFGWLTVTQLEHC